MVSERVTSALIRKVQYEEKRAQHDLNTTRESFRSIQLRLRECTNRMEHEVHHSSGSHVTLGRKILSEERRAQYHKSVQNLIHTSHTISYAESRLQALVLTLKKKHAHLAEVKRDRSNARALSEAEWRADQLIGLAVMQERMSVAPQRENQLCDQRSSQSGGIQKEPLYVAAVLDATQEGIELSLENSSGQSVAIQTTVDALCRIAVQIVSDPESTQLLSQQKDDLLSSLRKQHLRVGSIDIVEKEDNAD